jgi:hypothetical protein
MSSEVVYNCATCFKTIKGKEHYAICVMWPRRVHRKCYGDCLSNSRWTLIRQTFSCSMCKAEVNAEGPVPVLASRGKHFNSNYCSDGQRQSMENTVDRSTYVPPTTIKNEIMIYASQKDGDIVSDGCGYTYSFKIDYPNFIVLRCTFRGWVKIPRCNSTLKQMKNPGVDFFRTYFQEDFTLNVNFFCTNKAHRHPPNGWV